MIAQLRGEVDTAAGGYRMAGAGDRFSAVASGSLFAGRGDREVLAADLGAEERNTSPRSRPHGRGWKMLTPSARTKNPTPAS